MGNFSVVSISNLSKVYHIYNEPADRLKEALNPFKKEYHKKFHALDNISLEIQKGESVGLIGKNGAGKSTLLKIITGVLTPTSGSVKVKGKVASLLELGAGFNPEMTGIENIYLNGTVMGYTKAEIDKKVDDIIEFADIGDFVFQPVKMYSSGMFARLAFSVAINVDPDILIIDEALSVGDMAFQNKCFERISNFRKEGKTVIFVSHSLSAIRLLCEKAAWIKNGKLIAYGETKSITQRYEKENYSNVTCKNLQNDTAKIPDLESRLIKDRVKSFGEKAANATCYFSDIFIPGLKEGSINVETFSDITIEIEICNVLKHSIDIGLGIAITRQDGLEITRINNIRDDMPISLKAGYSTITLFFQQLNLLDGEYFFSFFLSLSNLLESFHKIEHYIKLSVETPYSQCGWKISEGVTALTHRWRVDS